MKGAIDPDNDNRMKLREFIEKTNENIKKATDIGSKYSVTRQFPKEVPTKFWTRIERNTITVKSNNGRSGYAFSLNIRLRRTGPSYNTKMVPDRVEIAAGYEAKLDKEMSEIYAEAEKEAVAYNDRKTAETNAKQEAFDAKLKKHGITFDDFLELRRMSRELHGSY